ncbi:DUF4143 domain-containing protein [Bdellovibrionota bacterium FG-2]
MGSHSFKRILAPLSLLKKSSFFLFGPRSTGKTSLIKTDLGSKALIFDLLKSSLLQKLMTDHGLFEGMIDLELRADPKRKYIIIDEVHRLIEERRFRFLLGGSSARKLKKDGANSLAGRAWKAELFPLTSEELTGEFDLTRYLRWGGLPRVVTSGDPAEELDAYVGTYLKEEIQQEGLVRKLPHFPSFLRLAALSSGQLLNYESFSKEVGVSAPTIKEYYSILIDTLLAFELEPFSETKKRKAVSTLKIFLFDPGVTNFLAEVESLDRASDLYGNRLEQFIGMELRAYLSYRRKKDALRFWRSHQQDEVDFVIGRHTAIEVKATKKIDVKHLKGLRTLSDEGIFEQSIIVSHDPVPHKKNGIQCMSIEYFLKQLWSDKLF